MKIWKSLWFLSLDFGLDVWVGPDAEKESLELIKTENEHFYIDGKSIPLSDFRNSLGQTIGEFLEEVHTETLHDATMKEIKNYGNIPDKD